MRLAWVALLVAACGSEEGSLLTIRAPEGPEGVARLEIVLAKADGFETVQDQRLAPSNFAGSEDVRYYRQRATAGEIEAVGKADGFTVRIEPNIAMVPEKTFTPFLVAYDAQDNVVGVGAVLDEAGEPTTITIEGGATRKYFVDMVPLKPMDPALGMGERESLHVVCGDGPKWTSGIAWRPATTQLRLLLADRSQDPSATDASERAADLDCDGHAAPETDCDDLRSTFHAARADACDGFDTNCDGARTTVQPCANGMCANGGVQLCDDRTGQPVGACVASSSCACAAGACAACALAFRATADAARKAPCTPGAGKLHLPSCVDGATCTVEVLSATAPWVGYVSAMPASGFTTKVADVIGQIYIELKLSGTSDLMAGGGESVGTLNLLITQNNQSVLLPVDIQLRENGLVSTCDVVMGTNLSPMTCTP